MNNTNQQGFSLVELMVVVAIIGILSAVAIPQYSKFQAKSRQSEAKTNLGGLYTAMSAFHSQWSQYYGDFEDIGMTPRGDLYYNFGFAAADLSNSPDVPEYNGQRGRDGAPVEFTARLWANNAGPEPDAPVVPIFRPDAGLDADIPAVGIAAADQDQQFAAHAVGDIDSEPAFDDAWFINHNKQLRNCADPADPDVGCTPAELRANPGNDVDNDA